MAQMQFWGVEVKAKEPCTVALDGSSIVHLSQATLGDIKKDNENVIVHVKVGDKKLVLGVLSQINPQLSFDLVFEKDFEISHNWKNGSVHLMGYQSELGDYDEFESSDEDEEEELPIPKENAKPAVPAAAAKPAAAKPKMKPVEESDDDESDDDEDDSDEDADDSDDGMSLGDSDDDDDDSEDDEDEDETPVKPESGKKRPNGNAKTPDAKKAKLVTPQKTDAKKGATHSATPHPKKTKTPAADKSPKSGSQVSCGSCKKTFNSDKALESHSKAKHGAK